MKRAIKTSSWLLGVALLGSLALTGCDGGGDGSGIGERGEGGGFLWKPRSESNGRLVILLPTQYRRQVSSQFVADGDGNVLETGVFTTDEHNGDRPHFRYSRPGASFGNNVYAVADLTGGGTVHWPIPNGAARTEY